MKHMNSTATLVLLGCALSGMQAQAAELEEVVVTAQYRAEPLQEVPVAVTAFTAEDISQLGIESTRDFIAMTPNMTMDESFTLGNSFVQVRGVAQINNADSPVAIVVDGVPQNNQKQFKQELFDIERIEVLKGPQGSLYGRNAIGGAINIVSKAPTNEFEGSVKAGVGNGGLEKFSGSVSGPIIQDKLLFRVAGAYKDFDGVTENNFLDKKVDFYDQGDLRARLLWNVTDDFTIDGRFSISQADGGCCSDTFLYNPLTGTAPNPTGIENPNANEYNEPRMNVLGKTTNLSTTEYTLKATYDMGFAEATYIFNNTDVNEKYYADLDFTDGVDFSLGAVLTAVLGFPVAVGQQQVVDVDLTSHEVRLTSPADQRLRWIAGAYYLQTDRYLKTIAPLDFTPTTPILTEDGLAWAFPLVSLEENNDNDAWALFGQVEYDIFDDLELTLGLRYDHDKRRHEGIVFGPNLTTDRSKSFSDLQPRVVLTKKWTDDLLTYASYSRGFRSGGFNGPAIGSASFKEETLDNFELGLKSMWLDNRLLLNASVYYGKDDNFQFFYVDLITASQVIANIEDVDLVGAEIEMQALLTDNWSVYGIVGISDGEIKNSVSRPQDEGNHTPKNQKYSLNFGTQYTWPQIIAGLDARVRVDYEHRGRKYWHTDDQNSMDPFGLLNGRLSVENENFTVSVWADNIFQQSYWQDYNAAAFSGAFGDIGFLARGRTFGADFEYRF